MKYFKIIVVVLSFSLTLYIQHVNNTSGEKRPEWVIRVKP